MSEEAGGIRSRGEEVIGDLAQVLLENPLFSQALGKALGAGERAAGAQRAALNAIDVPSAGDLERLSRRVRASPTGSRRSRTRSTGAAPRASTVAPTGSRPDPQLEVESAPKRRDGGVGEPQQRRVEWVVVSRRPSTLRTTSARRRRDAARGGRARAPPPSAGRRRPCRLAAPSASGGLGDHVAAAMIAGLAAGAACGDQRGGQGADRAATGSPGLARRAPGSPRRAAIAAPITRPSRAPTSPPSRRRFRSGSPGGRRARSPRRGRPPRWARRSRLPGPSAAPRPPSRP